jgi:hypothetical protein
MSIFDGIEKVGGPPLATEAQLEFIYKLLAWLADDTRDVDQAMTREQASELIDELKAELDERRFR